MGVLRSWLKQERKAARGGRWTTTLRTGGLLLVPLLSLEGLRRYNNSRDQLEQRQRDQLEVVRSVVAHSHRPLADWAQWDDSFDFVQGRLPDFVPRLMRTTALLENGAVMAIHDGSGRSLALEGVNDGDRRSASPLRACLDAVAQPSLRQGMNQLAVICPGRSGPLVGGLMEITDTAGSRRSRATLTYLVPLLSSAAPSSLNSGLREISRELVLTPASDPTGLRPMQPPMWTSGGRPVLVRTPSLRPALLREGLALGGLLAGAGLLGLTLRMQWMLGKRRRALRQRQHERQISQRIHNSERDLTALLDQVQQGGETPEAKVFARLLQRREADLTRPVVDGDEATPASRRRQQLAERLELVLDTARALALLDPITNLPNRNYFLERLNWESERSRREGRPLALLFINIDKFKELNETYGHNTGDSTLQHVASELRQLIGQHDFLARFGGDEFSLILSTAHLSRSDEDSIRDHAHQRALELLEAFQRRASSQPEQIKLSLSIGIAVSDPAGTTPEELIRRSDMAMVMAKTGRQKRVTVFDIETDRDALNNYRLFNALQSDISHAPERFQILFQPIVDGNGQIFKVEALTRWHNPDFPAVPADVFFALAERYRLVPELGRLLVTISLQELNRLREELGRPDLGLSLNVSPSQLSLEGFSPWLLSCLQEAHISPQTLTVEITESAVIETSVQLTDNLNGLRRAGVQIALDDFGTGYSSLRLLMWLKPDELKIDKSFVLAAAQDPLAHQIVRLLDALARKMRLTLVAEGVEDQGMLELLRGAGLERFQGYLFARPLSRQDLVASAARLGFGPSRPAPLPLPLPGHEAWLGNGVTANAAKASAEATAETTSETTADAEPIRHDFTLFELDNRQATASSYRLFHALRSDISHAPERFTIEFQPIVDANEQLFKVEALARWHNPEFADVPAEGMFSLAERHHLIPELGRLLVDRSLQELRLLREELGRPDLGMVLNITPTQVGLEDFSSRLLAQLSAHRISPQTITVDITESAVIEPGFQLTDNLDSLRRAGVRIALDDFGTGYSSLRLLMWLKPDELKIDKSLVMAAAHDPLAHQIVHMLDALARKMRLTLVAEGVEDQAMLSLLRGAGLERFQGYLFSRPLSRRDLVAWSEHLAPHPSAASA